MPAKNFMFIYSGQKGKLSLFGANVWEVSGVVQSYVPETFKSSYTQVQQHE